MFWTIVAALVFVSLIPFMFGALFIILAGIIKFLADLSDRFPKT